jgi:hypothetical protein
MARQSAVRVTAISTVWNLSKNWRPDGPPTGPGLSETWQTWITESLASLSNSSGLSAIHGRMVRTWTTYCPAKNPGLSIVQCLKNTPSLPKLDSSNADGPAYWLRWSAKRRQRQTTSWPLRQSHGRSAVLREKKYFALIQKNSNFETRSAISPHAHVTVYALRGTKLYTIQVH